MKKKYVTNLEMYKIINELLSNTEGLVKGASKPDCTFYRKPVDKGYVRICVTTKCEGSVIGTFWIDHIPDKDKPTQPYNIFDIWSGLITIYDDPYLIVKRILRSIEDYFAFYESDMLDYLEDEDTSEYHPNVLNGKEVK